MQNTKIDLVDARIILGDYYVDKIRYKEAIYSFSLFDKKSNKKIGLKRMSDMYRREQYDSAEEFNILVKAYIDYYDQFNTRDILQKSAKAGKQYFYDYIENDICETYDLYKRDKKNYEREYKEEDFALPLELRKYDCSDFISVYATRCTEVTLEGCLLYLISDEIYEHIMKRTSEIRQLTYKTAYNRTEIHRQNEVCRLNEKMIDEQSKYNHEMAETYRKYIEEVKKASEEHNNLTRKKIEQEKQHFYEQEKAMKNIKYELDAINYNTRRY